MRVEQIVLLMLGAMCWESSAAPTAAVRLCGRRLSQIMTRVCQAYNSPAWDDPTVVENPDLGLRRRRRQIGIADECCTMGCTWEQLTDYCAIRANPDLAPALENESHMIEDRSAEERDTARVATAEVRATATAGATPRQVGALSRGYARRRRRCRCARRRRARLPSPTHLGNTDYRLTRADRAAAVVGTVSPLLTWGRTVHEALPASRDLRDGYVAVYALR